MLAIDYRKHRAHVEGAKTLLIYWLPCAHHVTADHGWPSTALIAFQRLHLGYNITVRNVTKFDTPLAFIRKSIVQFSSVQFCSVLFIKF